MREHAGCNDDHEHVCKTRNLGGTLGSGRLKRVLQQQKDNEAEPPDNNDNDNYRLLRPPHGLCCPLVLGELREEEPPGNKDNDNYRLLRPPHGLCCPLALGELREEEPPGNKDNDNYRLLRPPHGLCCRLALGKLLRLLPCLQGEESRSRDYRKMQRKRPEQQFFPLSKTGSHHGSSEKRDRQKHGHKDDT